MEKFLKEDSKCNYIIYFFLIFIVQLELFPFFPHCSLLPCPPPSHTQSPSLSLSMGPLYMFLDLTLPLVSPIISLPHPLWLLSDCSLFPCLWFCFAHLFLLLIRFHLQVRSYGIFLSLPGLFQTLQYQYQNVPEITLFVIT